MASNGMVDISIFGNVELEKALHKLPTNVQRRLTNRALKRGAEIVLHAAQLRVRRLTGTLASLLTVAPLKGGRGSFGYTVMTPRREILVGGEVQKSNGYYPQHLEYGSKHNRPYPYMRPAADENVDKILAQVEADLIAEVEAAQ